MADTIAIDELNIFRDGNFDAVSDESRRIYDKLGIQSRAVVEQRIYDMLSKTDMPPNAIRSRLRLACDLEDEFIYTLLWLYLTQDGDKENIYNQFYEDYGKGVEDFLKENGRTKDTAYDRRFDFSDFVTETTLKDKDYTEDRAVNMALTESLVLNDTNEYKEAIEQGKTKKTWNSVLIPSTRAWHREAHGQTVDIDDYFFVGGEPMKYPHDPNASAENLVGCLCFSTYG